MKKKPLVRKLSVSFFIVVIGSILITSIMANNMVDKRFNNYLEEQHKANVEKLIILVQGFYDENGNTKNFEEEKLIDFAQMKGFYISIENIQGKVIFSYGKQDLLHKEMMSSMMGRGMMSGRMKKYMNFGEYTEEKHNLLKNNKKIGEIIIGYLGNYNITQQDMQFKSTLNQSFLHSVIAALVFSFIVSIILSRQLTIPLVEINKIANEMKKGNFKIKSSVDTNTLEISELSQTINYLAGNLDKQDAIRKRLTSDMAHEIRTPLATLQNYMESFIDGIWEPTIERFESCHEEILRITKLVEKLQEVAKVEQDGLLLNKSRFDLSLEIKKLVDVFQPLYARKELKFILDIEPDIKVFMDKDKLKQIIYNLFSNAHRYSNIKGIVKVRVNKKINEIVIAVKDNGIGISKEDLPLIFERFYRGEASRSRETGGTGIGLTITKALVEAHGGSIEVKSQLGVGSEFIIKIPQ